MTETTTEPMKLPEAGGQHDEREIEAVVEVLRTSKLDIGPAVAEMERRTAELLAKRHGVMVNSGSSALRLAIDLLGLEPGDEIITSPLTFSTDIAPMVQSGIVPVFADVDTDTYQIDANRIAEMIGPRTRAILVPNLCGNVPDWDAIRAIADEHGLAVVEDSCDVLDSWLGDTRTGTRSDISVTSFARSHAITAGGTGGMVGVDDDDLLDRCLSLRRWGRRSEPYLFGSEKGQHERFGELADGTPYDLIFVFDSIGYNFEPSEIGAAYGLVQLDKLDRFNGRRHANWQRLHDHVAAAAHPGVTQGVTTPGARTTWMRYCFTVPADASMSRNEVQGFLEARGVSTRMVWTGNILRQPGFAAIEHRRPETGLPNCDHLMDRALSLPVHHGLESEHMDYICEQLDDLFATLAGR
jgi:CDP-6-deoxy-D-xylo-4-hexulose-3-dehydrase